MVTVRETYADETGQDPRSIRNARTISDTPPAYQESVEAQFAREKSIEAQILRKKAREEEQKLEELDRIFELQEMQQQVAGAQKLYNTIQGTTVTSARKARRLSGFARWMGLGIVFTVYIWQLIFALISLFFFVIQAGIISLQKDTTLGSIIDRFIDVQKYFPGELVGMIFWALASILSVAVFFGYYIWFKISGVHPFSTLLGFLVSVLCIVLSLIPITNLFPWTIIWIVYFAFFSLFTKSR